LDQLPVLSKLDVSHNILVEVNCNVFKMARLEVSHKTSSLTALF